VIIRIEELSSVHNGEGVSLSISLSSGENSEARCIVISVQAYIDMGKPSPGIVLDEGRFEELEEEAQIYDCIRRGLYLLSYGDNNRAQLARKLVEKGYSREHAALAAKRLYKLGYINEGEQARRKILYLANKKLYGRRRIVSELYAGGYPREIISAGFAECEGEIDYDENKRRLLERKFGAAVPKPENRAEYEKIRGFLYRYGY